MHQQPFTPSSSRIPPPTLSHPALLSHPHPTPQPALLSHPHPTPYPCPPLSPHPTPHPCIPLPPYNISKRKENNNAPFPSPPFHIPLSL